MATFNTVIFKNEFHPESTNWLLANIGEKITAEVTVRPRWRVTSSDDDLYFFGVVASDVITSETTNFIESGFVADDLIKITYSGAPTLSGTVVQIQTVLAQALVLTAPLDVVGSVGESGAEVQGITGLSALDFQFNLSRNTDDINFTSLIDQNTPRYFAQGKLSTDLTTTVMEAQGLNRSWQTGSATVKGNSTDIIDANNNNTQSWTITHEFVISPLFLVGQLTSLQADQQPEYYDDTECLRYDFKVDTLYVGTDPNRSQSAVLTATQGNTGWFDENFNQGEPKYDLISVAYEDATTGAPFDSLDFAKPTLVTIRINSIDSTFSGGNTQFDVGHVFLPDDDDQIINTPTDHLTNMIYDRAHATLGGLPIDGINFGTTLQVITDVQSSLIGADEMEITFVVSLGSSAQTTISGRDDKDFILWITTQDHTKSTSLADKVAVKIIGVYEAELDIAEDVAFDSMLFINPSQSDFTGLTTTTVEAFVEDGVVARTDFTEDITDQTKIQTTDLVIYATDGTNEFDLKRESFDLTSAVLNGDIQEIAVNDTAGFILPEGDIRNELSYNRETSLDSGNLKGYRIIHAFRIRWEEFISLVDVNGVFFDTNEPNNGLNNQWLRYFQEGGWTIRYRVEGTVVEDGELKQFFSEVGSELLDYDEFDDDVWTTTLKETLRTDLTVLPTVSGNVVFLKNADTRVRFTFTNTLNDYLAAELWGYLALEEFESSGENGSVRIYSLYDVLPDQGWKSVDASNKMLITRTGANTYTGEALIDPNDINLLTNYKLSGRIAPIGTIIPPPFCLTQEVSLDEIQLEDLSGCIEIEH